MMVRIDMEIGDTRMVVEACPDEYRTYDGTRIGMTAEEIQASAIQKACRGVGIDAKKVKEFF